MNAESTKEVIKRELPALLRDDPELRAHVLELVRSTFPDRKEMDDRFWAVLDELRRDREEQNRKWEEQVARWEEQRNLDRQEQARKWDAQDRKWEQSSQAALREQFKQLHEDIATLSDRLDRRVGALGARWGMQSETSFRNALAGILERNFGVQVVNVNEYDDRGEVFGRPEQIELDIIVRNGLLLICELESSIDKAGMYIFERKARFYEKRHDRKADRLIVISPMIDPKAAKVAQKLGIETYSDSIHVETL